MEGSGGNTTYSEAFGSCNCTTWYNDTEDVRSWAGEWTERERVRERERERGREGERERERETQ